MYGTEGKNDIFAFDLSGTHGSKTIHARTSSSEPLIMKPTTFSNLVTKGTQAKVKARGATLTLVTPKEFTIHFPAQIKFTRVMLDLGPLTTTGNLLKSGAETIFGKPSVTEQYSAGGTPMVVQLPGQFKVKSGRIKARLPSGMP